MFSRLQKKLAQNEVDMYSFSAFTLANLYPSEAGIYRRSITKLTGFRLHDLKQIVETALIYLNNDNNHQNSNNNQKFSSDQFLIGFFRTTPIDGNEYELYFKNHGGVLSCCAYLKLNRPFSTELKLIESNVNSATNNNNNNYYGSSDEANLILNADNLLRVTSNGKQMVQTTIKKTINFILPLSDNLVTRKREGSIKLFLNMFEKVAIGQDSAEGGLHGVRGQFVTLTVVFKYKNSGLKKRLESILSEFKHRTNFLSLKLIQIRNGQFSRAKLLQIGVENLSRDNDQLLFFCDVDVVFSPIFLDLCRFNAVRNRRVFFPILFSLYNSKFPRRFSASSSTEEPARLEWLIGNRDVGFWRDSGFGMVCVYREDFEAVGGFLHYARRAGWGGEDLDLYRRFLTQTDLEVFRSITPGLFHVYHEKKCDRSELGKVELEDCWNVKVMSETSQRRFGLQFFNRSEDKFFIS